MNCDDAIERFSEALDGALGEGERAEMEGHLAGCAACRARRGELTEIRGLLRSLEDPESGGERAAAVSRGVMQVVKAGPPAAVPESPAPATGRNAPIAVVVLAILGIGAVIVLNPLAWFEDRIRPRVTTTSRSVPLTPGSPSEASSSTEETRYVARAVSRDVLRDLAALFKDCPGRAAVGDIREDGAEFVIEIETTMAVSDEAAAFRKKVGEFQARNQERIVGWSSRSSTR